MHHLPSNIFFDFVFGAQLGWVWVRVVGWWAVLSISIRGDAVFPVSFRSVVISIPGFVFFFPVLVSPGRCSWVSGREGFPSLAAGAGGLQAALSIVMISDHAPLLFSFGSNGLKKRDVRLSIQKSIDFCGLCRLSQLRAWRTGSLGRA